MHADAPVPFRNISPIGKEFVLYYFESSETRKKMLVDSWRKMKMKKLMMVVLAVGAACAAGAIEYKLDTASSVR